MKNYTMNLIDGRKIPLLARHNREAMRLSGAYSRNTGAIIDKVTDEAGVLIIKN